MNRLKYVFQKACGILCVLCIYSLQSSAQTELLVTYHDQTNEIFVIGEHGKLYFSETELIVENGELSPITIPISTIRKINVTAIEDDISITEHTIAEEANIILYPNPAKDYIRIESPNLEKFPVSIYSITGQVMLEGYYMSGDKIDVSNFSSGLYIVKIDKEVLKFSKLFFLYK